MQRAAAARGQGCALSHASTGEPPRRRCLCLSALQHLLVAAPHRPARPLVAAPQRPGLTGAPPADQGEPPLPMPDGSAGSAREPFWVVDDMYHFDNMAFSRTVGARKFLCCPDCEFGPLGYREITAQQPGAAELPPGEDGSPPVVCYVAAERVAHASAACPARPNKQMDSAALAGLMPQLALPNGAACSRGTPSLSAGARRRCPPCLPSTSDPGFSSAHAGNIAVLDGRAGCVDSRLHILYP
eukprot:COSAG01_NODE_852_length_13108_cov_7.167423_1_plen_242_part_00